MANKRPSYVSIRARKVKLIKYMGSTNKTEAQTAKEFGVSKAQLRRFITQSPKQLRKTYNQSPAQRKLYDEVGAPKPRYVAKHRVETFRGTRLTQYAYKSSDIDEIRKMVGLDEKVRQEHVQIGRMIQAQYTGQTPETLWAIYTREHNTPQSLSAMKVLSRNNQLSNAAIKAWVDIYGISEKYFEDQLPDEDYPG